MIVAVTPIVGWSLPLLWPLLLSTAGALGYGFLTDERNDLRLRSKLDVTLKNTRLVTVPLDTQLTEGVADEVKGEQVLRFQKGDITVAFKRDARGKFTIHVSGPQDKTTDRQLQKMGEEFAREVIQQFVASKVAAALTAKNSVILNQEVEENGDIVINLRRWK